MGPLTFSDDDHHFVLDTGVVITIPAKNCNMYEAAERVNVMLEKIDPAKYGSRRYGWAMRHNGFFMDLGKK